MKIYPANILLPDFSRIDGRLWATVACDQYTSEPEYWERVSAAVAGSPSTLELMLPEVWLSDAASHVPEIHKKMDDYLSDGTLTLHSDCGIYLERRQHDGRIRRGLVACIDLEDYDYMPGSSAPIRATEKTVVERIPPRLAIRRGAPLEMPHVMLLADDKEGVLFAPFADRAPDAYDFELMENGGHVSASYVTAGEIEDFSLKLNGLVSGDHPMILAVGDGNHSLASARAAWDEIKPTLSAEDVLRHPARYALCEIVNVHDTALDFEPIYRLVNCPDPRSLAEDFARAAEELNGDMDPQVFTLIVEGEQISVAVPHPEMYLPVATLQKFLDRYAASHPGTVTDYIHGDDTLRRLASRAGSVGFLFDGMTKESLFSAVENDGALPRKTFSMGHAHDKRFYIECRKIR